MVRRKRTHPVRPHRLSTSQTAFGQIDVFAVSRLLILQLAASSHGCDAKMATQVVILRAVRSFAPNLATLIIATMAKTNRLLGGLLAEPVLSLGSSSIPRRINRALIRLVRFRRQALLGEKSSGALHDGLEIFLSAFLETRNVEKAMLAAFECNQLAHVARFPHQAIEAFDVFKRYCPVCRAVDDEGGRQA